MIKKPGYKSEKNNGYYENQRILINVIIRKINHELSQSYVFCSSYSLVQTELPTKDKFGVMLFGEQYTTLV